VPFLLLTVSLPASFFAHPKTCNPHRCLRCCRRAFAPSECPATTMPCSAPTATNNRESLDSAPLRSMSRPACPVGGPPTEVMRGGQQANDAGRHREPGEGWQMGRLRCLSLTSLHRQPVLQHCVGCPRCRAGPMTASPGPQYAILLGPSEPHRFRLIRSARGGSEHLVCSWSTRDTLLANGLFPLQSKPEVASFTVPAWCYRARMSLKPPR
jgi:hypothetical protein